MKLTLLSGLLFISMLMLYYFDQTSAWSQRQVAFVQRDLVLKRQSQRTLASKGSLISHTPSEPANRSVACHFPKQDPFDPLITKHFKYLRNIDCTRGLPSLVYLEGNSLNVNWTKARLKNIQVDRCNYTTITRGKNDFKINRTSRESFTNSIEIDSKHEHINVECLYRSKIVSRTYLTRIVKKDLTEKTCEENYKRHIEQNSPLETLSVLLVGMDGTSRQNSIRSMRRTRNFIVNNMSAIEFYKVNQLGKNTFPNILPMVSGLHVEDLRKLNWRNRDHYDSFDHLFLWHRYKQAGYQTAMMQDHHYVTPFQYQKRGWKNPPFDYYHRPMAIERSRTTLRIKQDCVGDIPEITFLLDYCHQVTTTFNNTKTKPYFAFSFNMRMTHDNPNKAIKADKLYFNFFHKLVESNVLNNTVIIFFADHGPRFGISRNTPPGILEANTPFLFFMFPPWFHTKYPDVIATFRTNQHRLTTFFDVHATLKDILHFKGKTGKGNLRSRGISLFKEIPADRLCQHAGIPHFHCMCSQNISVPSSRKEILVDALLKYIINKTSSHRSVCRILQIQDIYYISPLDIGNTCVTCSNFRVTISIASVGFVFEAVLEHDSKSDTVIVLEEQRLARYGEKQRCDVPRELKGYCYCRDGLPSALMNNASEINTFIIRI